MKELLLLVGFNSGVKISLIGIHTKIWKHNKLRVFAACLRVIVLCLYLKFADDLNLTKVTCNNNKLDQKSSWKKVCMFCFWNKKELFRNALYQMSYAVGFRSVNCVSHIYFLLKIQHFPNTYNMKYGNILRQYINI